MRYTRRVCDALRAVNALLVRHNKHAVYRLPNGRIYVLSSTPSDTRQEMNAIKGLQRTAALPPMEGACQH